MRAQLEEYFAGRRPSIELTRGPQGTPFQRRVWSALQEIPYGETLTYGELARRIDQPTAARAVGLANGSNPIAVIVPCHRLFGSNGTLVDYGGGSSESSSCSRSRPNRGGIQRLRQAPAES